VETEEVFLETADDASIYVTKLYTYKITEQVDEDSMGYELR
jgi:hypothetical protein